MAMQSARIVGLVAGLAGVAGADTFGGFSSIDVPYLVNQDRICAPLAVANGVAAGVPACAKAAADDIAKLTVKPGVIESGAKATFAATAAARTLTVTKQGSTAVVWVAPDPIGRVVDVFASTYEDRVAITYTTRQLGKEVTNVIAFVIVKTTGRDTTTTQSPARPGPPVSPPATATAPLVDPAVTKAVVAARNAGKGKALAAWQAVLVTDPAHSEARYRIAVIQAGAKRPVDAIGALEQLANSSRVDAIEWLVEARRDPAFASVRGDTKFRAAVGLDRPPGTASGQAYGPAGQAYDRLMGFGGHWEQAGTSCDAPEIRLALERDRRVKLNVKLSCNGQVDDLPFKGTWRIDDADHVTLVLPTKGHAATAKDEAGCVWKPHGEEFALHCVVGKDLEFEVLPTRR